MVKNKENTENKENTKGEKKERKKEPLAYYICVAEAIKPEPLAAETKHGTNYSCRFFGADKDMLNFTTAAEPFELLK